MGAKMGKGWPFWAHTEALSGLLLAEGKEFIRIPGFLLAGSSIEGFPVGPTFMDDALESSIPSLLVFIEENFYTGRNRTE